MDSISNMFVAIKNAQANKRQDVLIPFSKVKMSILQVLKDKDYIKEFQKQTKEDKDYINVIFNYKNGESTIHSIKRISKPGRKVYIKNKEIPIVLNGYGISIISTPKGIVSGHEAKKQNLGGELIAEVW